jgi:hypothetical protein
LEVNDLPNSLQFVKINLVLWFNVENTGELLVIERDCMESIFLYISDFLSDDHFLEVNHRMLYLHVLVLKYFLCLLFVIILAEVFNGPMLSGLVQTVAVEDAT